MHQTSMVQPLKFVIGYVILSHTLLGMWLLMHAAIEVDYTQLYPNVQYYIT